MSEADEFRAAFAAMVDGPSQLDEKRQTARELVDAIHPQPEPEQQEAEQPGGWSDRLLAPKPGHTAFVNALHPPDEAA